MELYIAVDTGKYQTKCAFYCEGMKGPVRYKFRTKMDTEGTFLDDMFERGTFITQVDGGPVVKLGQQAKGEPPMETSKANEIHRTCALFAIAKAVAETGCSDVNVVLGIPKQVCDIANERIEYKEYMLGEDEHEISIKRYPNSPVETVKFVIRKRLVYPEGIGVLYDAPSTLQDTAAIIDIGNLNTNHIYCDSFIIRDELCFTGEMGGKVLISGLASDLSSKLGSRVDENLVASRLLKPKEERFLIPNNGNEKIKWRSKEIIDEYLLRHVLEIKRHCDSRHWPLDFMNIACIGGTAKILRPEIEDVFGKNVYIPADSEYSNVSGFLKKMCASDNIDIASGTVEKSA